MAEEYPGEHRLLPGGEGDRGHGQRTDRKRQSQRDDLVANVRAVPGDSPDLIQRDLQRKKNAGGTDQQHDDGKDLRALVRMRQLVHVLHDEVLRGGEEVAHHLADDLLHNARVEDLAGDRQHHHNERKEREDDVGRNREGVGVDLGLHHVVGQRGELRPGLVAAHDGTHLLDGNGRGGFAGVFRGIA